MAAAKRHLVYEDEARRFLSLRLQRPFDFCSPFGDQDFALLLFARDAALSADEQRALSNAFVAQGCRYAVCAGLEPSSWDDSIDEAYLAMTPAGDARDPRFVMTSWHEDEPIEEVAAFFVGCTSFDDFVPARFLVVCLGGNQADEVALRRTVLAAITDS